MGKDKNKVEEYAKKTTLLAQERTMLAYWRTALTMIALGLLVAKFFNSASFIIAGLLVAVGCILFFYGTKKYLIRAENLK